MTLTAAEQDVERRLRSFGLLPSEYQQILRRLGREPNEVELGMLGAMWSEHCGYKHSRTLLKLLPTAGRRVLQGPGENAGAVDIGHGLAVVLKMESHNHPSAVEPFQGAATGVGGIVRDIFTMGARPVALLDSLRFGDPSDARTAYLIDGVIGGIGHYGNCIGVPTVGGEISFHPGYAGNPLVNAMCVGIAPHQRLTRATARGAGNPLLLVGADTGRDGLQGAAFASNDDPEASHRGVVQVGNPFLEKLLLEACLSILDSGDVLAMQDLGAAGLTSSAIEMAARGGLGVQIDVAQVPRREAGLSPFEVMLSESQERMLLLVRAGSESAVAAHFARWELHAAVIGKVTGDGLIRVTDGTDEVVRLPIALLTDEVPAYNLEAAAPPAAPPRQNGQSRVATPTASAVDFESALLRLVGSPELRSRRFAFRQYDGTVQGNTVFGPGQAAAAVIRVDGTAVGLALTTDCTPRLMLLDPRRGAEQAVAEAARNVACVGALPVAVTDCLNFGNPEKPGVAWQLTEAVHGLAAACQALGVPIVSGNVSLYNESGGRPIPPTPAVGMVGLLDDVTLAVPVGFAADRAVIVLGLAAATLGAGVYADMATADGWATMAQPDVFPRLDLAEEQRLGDTLRALSTARLLSSAQDVSDGGLAMALVECALAGDTGARVTLDGDVETALFSEDGGRALVTCAPEVVRALTTVCRAHGVAAHRIGDTGGHRLSIGSLVDVSLADLRAAHEVMTL